MRKSTFLLFERGILLQRGTTCYDPSRAVRVCVCEDYQVQLTPKSATTRELCVRRVSFFYTGECNLLIGSAHSKDGGVSFYTRRGQRKVVGVACRGIEA